MKIGTKLICILVAFAFVATMATTLLSAQAVSNSFSSYFQDNMFFQRKQLAENIVSSYQIAGWSEVQDLIENMDDKNGLGIRGYGHGRMLGKMMGLAGEITVVDTKNRVVATNRKENLGKIVEQNLLNQGIPLMLKESQIGTLINVQGYGQLEENFIQSVKKANLMVGLLAFFVAVALGAFISKRLTAPLVSLTNAARRVAQKELSYRVPIVASDEIGELAQAFNQMAQSLEENEKLRKGMLADVAHELRTPLTILQGNLESLQEGVIDPSTAVFASLHDETIRISHLVVDLQELALAEAGELKMNRQPESLLQVLAGVTANFQMECNNRGIEFDVQIPEEVVVLVDSSRIQQVLYNLLSNAVKHSSPRGRIDLTVTNNEKWVDIAVIDTGSGIDPGDLPYLFDRFYRADKSRNRERGGIGLGLAIAKSLVQAHEGKIEVESKLGVGSKFTVHLPKMTDRVSINHIFT